MDSLHLPPVRKFVIHNFLTAMKEYENVSIEELRYEDYQQNRKNGSKSLARLTSEPEKFGFLKTRLYEPSQEYEMVANRFKETMASNKIVKIEKIENNWHWKVYSRSVEFLKEKSGGANEKLLFHGTRKVNPETIYSDEVGLDMRFSNNGMWGRAIYFAQDASYSQKYAHVNTDGSESMFLASVALGDIVELPAMSIEAPPFNHPGVNSSLIKKRYDSVKGLTMGSVVYMIYENGRVYPEYLITFKS